MKNRKLAEPLVTEKKNITGKIVNPTDEDIELGLRVRIKSVFDGNMCNAYNLIKNDNLKYSILTMGCQLNENDSEKISGMLTKMGYEVTECTNGTDVWKLIKKGTYFNITVVIQSFFNIFVIIL